MADVSEDDIKRILEILGKFKDRITKLEEKVAAIEPATDDDNNYDEPDEGHPYFGGSRGPGE